MTRAIATHIDTPAKFGKRLRTTRQDRGLSQRGLAFPGCTAAYISRLEAGERAPSLQMVNELAMRLHVSPRWLATGKKHNRDQDGIDPDYVWQLERDLEEARALLKQICDLAERFK